MAKVKLNPVLEKMRGKIGDLVFKRYHDEIIVSRTPGVEGKTPTPNQAAQREQFKLAALYGRAALADPATSALYYEKAKAKGQPVFALLISDFFHAPSVDEIDLSAYTGNGDETIKIRASDDFEVAGVAVRIIDDTGTALETGSAARNGSNGLEWVYSTKAAIPAGQHVSIEVTASDRPGHKTTRTQPRA